MLLDYPDLNQKVYVHTDASPYQLGVGISQNNKPLAFYSQWLTSAQEKYTTTERKLLAIVEILQ